MAHGALVGFMSTVSTLAIANTREAEETLFLLDMIEFDFLNRSSGGYGYLDLPNCGDRSLSEAIIC